MGEPCPRTEKQDGRTTPARSARLRPCARRSPRPLSVAESPAGRDIPHPWPVPLAYSRQPTTKPTLMHPPLLRHLAPVEPHRRPPRRLLRPRGRSPPANPFTRSSPAPGPETRIKLRLLKVNQAKTTIKERCTKLYRPGPKGRLTLNPQPSALSTRRRAPKTARPTPKGFIRHEFSAEVVRAVT
jgi:hypothetical protein